ncbi:hypothetical protein ACP70R_029463 [Stipagrostis hirtigluma subsp. patula]
MERKSEELLCGTTVRSKEELQLQLRDLPLDILSNIISRVPIRDAIRTSILSSQWKYVWCDDTNLTFSHYTLRRDCERTSPYGYRLIDVQEFIARVDSVLQQHSGTGVDRMEVSRALHSKHADHIDRWVKFAIVSKTKELILHLSDRNRLSLSNNMASELVRAEAYNFPCDLFCDSNGSHIRGLQLTNVSLNLPPNFNGFRNLQRLSMVHVNITEEHVEYLLSKCNLLEFLEIACCRKLAGIRTLHPMNQLKYLQVENCTFLKRIEMNCGLTTLKYSGPMVPLEFATTARLRHVSINKVLTFDTALDYITTGFPSTLPRLETFYLRCVERERANLPVRPLKYIYLRQLRLELTIYGNKERKADVLDYSYLLDAAPFMEELELHMWMECHHKPYREGQGELRILPSQSQQHTYLKSVYITGFFGHKDQIELALHILRRSAVLKEMKIDPRVKIMPGGPYGVPQTYKLHNYVDGYVAAVKFFCGAYHSNVVKVEGLSPRTVEEAKGTGNVRFDTGCWDESYI